MRMFKMSKYLLLMSLNSNSFAFFDGSELIGVVNPPTFQSLKKKRCYEDIILQIRDSFAIFTTPTSHSLILEWTKIAAGVLIPSTHNISIRMPNLHRLRVEELFSLTAFFDITFLRLKSDVTRIALGVLDHKRKIRMVFFEPTIDQEPSLAEPIISADIVVVATQHEEFLIRKLLNASSPSTLARWMRLETKYLVVLFTQHRKQYSERLKKIPSSFIIALSPCEKIGFTRHLHEIVIVRRGLS